MMSLNGFTPIVRWVDRGKMIIVTVDLSDTEKNPSIVLTENELKFTGYGRGAQGQNTYHLCLEFYSKIDYKHSDFKILDRYIEFHLLKQYSKEVWPRLLKSKEKQPWLRLDFDKLKIDDTEEEDDENAMDNIDKITFEQRLKTEIDKAKDDIKVFARVAWLTMYNLFQTVCYIIIFGKLMWEFYNEGKLVSATFYNKVSDLLLSCQIAAFAEIIHPIFGVVKTGVMAPLLQVCGRSFIIFVLIMPVKEMHTNFMVFVLFSVYSFIEIVRYPFYLLTLYRINNKFIKWVRYSIWLPLYPSGILCEVIIMLQSIPMCENAHRWEYPMPNSINFYFSLAAFIKCILPLFIMLSLYLIRHMWILRRKKLGSKPPIKND